MIIPVSGICLGVTQAGIKKDRLDDLVLISLSEGTNTAAVCTQNSFRAAPVQIAEHHLTATKGRARYFLINTGNANAGTGARGYQAAMGCCRSVAVVGGVEVEQVIPFSTGVIGEQLELSKIIHSIDEIFANLNEDQWERASSAILTTDTRPKLRSAEFYIDGQRCIITGMAKGSGMICPNLATMLAFVGTDATISPLLLNEALRSSVDCSFNRITVDGDTSTNDAVTLSATGKGPLTLMEKSPGYEKFQSALSTLLIDLAHDIVRDGEGSTKFVEVIVKGGESTTECDRVARAIAHSPLVKTALFAADPNFGRILAVIGRSGILGLDVDMVSISINGLLIVEQGARAPTYTEQAGLEAMAPTDLRIDIDLGRGDSQAVIWTTDLSHDYVRINAEYRT